MNTNTLFTNPFVEKLKQLDRDKIILHNNDIDYTSGQIWDDALTTAVWLRSQGIDQGTKVVFAIAPDHTFLSLFMGSMVTGATIAIIDPEMGQDNYLAKFEQLDPDLVFVDSRILLLREHPILRMGIKLMSKKHLPYFPWKTRAKLVACGIRLPIMRKHLRINKDLDLKESEIEWVEMDNHEPFLITYTSGTLTSPKGVVHTVKSISKTMEHLVQLLDDSHTKSISTHLPHYMLLGFLSGKEIYLWDNDLSGKDKLAFIERHQITTLFGPPSDFVTMLNEIEAYNGKPSSLTHIYLGSAPVYPNFLNRMTECLPQVDITCLYGMTENLLVSSISARDKLAYKGDGDILGKPFDGVVLKISTDHEILVSSQQLFLHYFEHDHRETFHPTGDQGFITNDGNIVLIGRKKDMIIRRHFNLYPALYEPTINRIPGISHAVLVGLYDDQKAEEVVVLCVETDSKLSHKVIMEKLKIGQFSIDKEAWPDKIVKIDLPRSGRQQKVDKKALRNDSLIKNAPYVS